MQKVTLPQEDLSVVSMVGGEEPGMQEAAPASPTYSSGSGCVSCIYPCLSPSFSAALVVLFLTSSAPPHLFCLFLSPPSHMSFPPIMQHLFQGPLQSIHSALITWGALSLAYTTCLDYLPLLGQLLLMSPAQLDLDCSFEHSLVYEKWSADIICFLASPGGCWDQTITPGHTRAGLGT